MTIKNQFSLFVILFISCFSYAAISAVEEEVIDCDPIVHLDIQAATLQKVLTLLAEQYHFDLTFPVDADRAVESINAMTLSQSLKYLTADLNIVLQHEKVEGCEKGKLIAMEVLPVGEDTEYVYVKPAVKSNKVVQKKVKQNKKPVYIDNMDLYAEEVLLNKRNKDRGLTREQHVEFRESVARVRPRLVDQGLLKPQRVERNNTRFNTNNSAR